jgi:hypothetical protein
LKILAQPCNFCAIVIQDYFASVNVTLMGGVPTGWRDLSRDSETDPAWAAVYRRFAVISPWTVGRYTSVGGLATVDNFLHKYIIPDKAAADAAGADYLPVVFPGGSAHYEPRQPSQPFNRCPRDGGTFLWRQLWNALGVAKVDSEFASNLPLLDNRNRSKPTFRTKTLIVCT